MREDFSDWLKVLKRLIKEDMMNWAGQVEPYDYVAQTGEECWKEMYDDGLSPAEAWQEEKDAIAQDCE